MDVHIDNAEVLTKRVKDGKTSGIIYVPKEYIGMKATIVFEK